MGRRGGIRAEAIAERLNAKLEAIWDAPQPKPVEIGELIASVEPRSFTLSDAVETYLDERGHGRGVGFEKLTRLAADLLVRIGGDKDVRAYDREDARAFLRFLQRTGVKTATIRRRMNTVKALLEFAYAECDAEKRNPFHKLRIPGEGLDATKRGTFTGDELRGLYRDAFASGSEVALLAPILGETGARMAEIVGLRWEDVFLDHEVPHIWIRPNGGRRLKTPGSERRVPLVGAALKAVELLHSCRVDGEGWVYARYEKEGTIRATHASNALNKWIKVRCKGMSAHCFRPTVRDRLRHINAPIDAADQIGGWSGNCSQGVQYGIGHKFEYIHDLMKTVSTWPIFK